jgi:uncharacterized protein
LIRILLLLAIALLVYLVIRSYFRSQKKPPAESPPSSAEGEDMVACARCGVNVPHSETRELDGRRVCATNPNCK